MPCEWPKHYGSPLKKHDTGRSIQAGDGGDNEKATEPPAQPPSTPSIGDRNAVPEPPPAIDRKNEQELRKASEEMRNAATPPRAPEELGDNADAKDRDPHAIAPWPSAPSNELKDRVQGPELSPAGARQRALKLHGGSRATMAAVDLASQWLAFHQEADGHWAAMKYGAARKSDTMVTALAALALMRAGNSPHFGVYRQNVSRAIAWLISKQNADGLILDQTDADSFRGIGFPGGIAALALCEAAAQTTSTETRDAAQLAVTYASAQQQGEGDERLGWSYAPRDNGDIRVSAWWIAALKAAKVARLSVPHRCFDGAIKFLDTIEIKDGGISRYNSQPGKDTNKRGSAMGLYCRQMLGWNLPDLQSSVEAFVNEAGAPAWGANGESVDLYYWYYGTQATFNQDGDVWARWNNGMKKALTENQCKQGDDTGSWPVAGDFSNQWGRVGQTAMGCLCLDVYFQNQNGQPRRVVAPTDTGTVVPAKAAVDSDDIIRKKLQTKVSFEFVDKPMPKVVEFLNDVCGVKFELAPTPQRRIRPSPFASPIWRSNWQRSGSASSRISTIRSLTAAWSSGRIRTRKKPSRTNRRMRIKPPCRKKTNSNSSKAVLCVFAPLR